MGEKLKHGSTKRRNIVNIGTSLMVVVLMGLSLAIIAALTISSAKNNYDLSSNLAKHNKEYYEACNKAYDILAEEGWADRSFEVEVNDNQKLAVEVAGGEIISWQVINTGSWEGDNSLPVHIGD